MGLTQVSTDGVKNDAITKTKIPANQIEASELADNAVDTNAIANNAVTAGKLASGVQTTINNNADNRVITGSGTANTLNGESNLVFDSTNLGIGAVTSGGAAIGQDKLDIRSGGIYLNSQSFATSGALSSKISFLKYHPSSAPTSYEQGRIEAYTENGYGAGGLDFYYGKSIGGGNYQATQGIRLNYQGNVGIGVIPTGNVYSGYNHLQVGESATLSSNDTQGDTNVTNLTNNVYLNSNASAWKRLHGDEASRYQQYNGIHNFAVAGADSADSTISFSNKLTIDTDGVKFNGDTSAANALDDYEEGTWSPLWSNASSGGTTVSNNMYGFYTKVGRLVTAHFHTWGLPTSGNSDAMYLQGLPFTSRTIGAVFSTVWAAYFNMGADNYYNLGVRVTENTSYARLYFCRKSSGDAVPATFNGFINYYTNFTGTITYLTT